MVIAKRIPPKRFRLEDGSEAHEDINLRGPDRKWSERYECYIVCVRIVKAGSKHKTGDCLALPEKGLKIIYE